MRDNYTLAIVGDVVTLVPYRPHHVPRYHEWMADPQILEATASEPLSIEEEFEMQKTWRDDPKKCTFIVLANEEDTSYLSEQDRMAGDVNFFLHDMDDPANAELEIMIAEERFRRRGFAREAVQLMMHYGVSHLGITRYFVKIHESNAASIALFKSFSFCEVNYVPAFQEYELALEVGEVQQSEAGIVMAESLISTGAKAGVHVTYSSLSYVDFDTVKAEEELEKQEKQDEGSDKSYER